MKFSSILVLIAILVSVMTPLFPTGAFASDEGMTFIHSLDVCSKSSPSLSVNSEMPGIYESACKQILLALSGSTEVHDTIALPFSISFCLERPPKI